MRYYIALLTKDGAERYRIQLPDFPDCMTWCETLADARLAAERMLAEAIELRAAAGQPIPRPTSPEWLLDRAARMKAIPVVVSAAEPMAEYSRGRVSVSVELPAGLVERVDERARVHGVGRSDLLEKAARLALWETARADRVVR